MKPPSTLILLALAILPASAQNEFLKPDGLAPGRGYTHVVVAKPGKLIILSGQVANNPQGQLVGKGDLKAQTTQVFENIKTALSAAGATFNDVVKITYYVRDFKPTDLPAIRAVRDSYVNTAAPPASTLVGVASLFQDDYLIEIEATAVIPDKLAKKPR
ncbi:MAG TPA: RidA family protein [Edaphobacter sp.]